MIIDANPESKEHQCYFESASVGMSVYSARGEWLNVNREFCKMLGYSREEIFCKSWKDIIHPDDLEMCYDYHKRILEGKIDNYHIDKRIIKKDGSVIHADVHVVCGRNADRSVTHLIATYIDNTEKYQIREEEKREFELLRLVIDNLNLSLYVLDKSGRKIISNKIDLMISGFDKEEKVLGKNLKEIWPGSMGESAHAENLEILASGSTIKDSERIYQLQDGSTRTALISKIPIITGDNEVLGLIGFGYDVTHLKQMESKARTSEEYYKTLIEVSPYGIIIVDANGHVNYASKNAYRIFCVPETMDISKLSVFDFVTNEDKEQAQLNFRESITGQINRKWEYRFIKYDKTEFWCEVITALLKDSDGNFKGLMIICNDISERKLAEEELIAAKRSIEQRDRFKTALLRNISHEIRTPLNAILGFTDLITDPGLSEQTKVSYVEIINKSSSQLLSTIDNLVDLSTIQAKITKKKISEVNINEVLAGIHNQFHLKAAKKNIQINVTSGLSESEAVVMTDRMKLYQVLSHLMGNALKFTWYGQVSMECHLKNKEIEFSVADTGIGIPAEFHSKIFDTFFRVENNQDIKADGIGMGLAICQAYVELLGGKIWLTSEPGKGSEFFFTIPYERARTSIEASATPVKLFKKGVTVLVVDDLETNLRYLADLLMMSDVKVLLARNGIDAVECFREEERIDLVLMDLRMPLMDCFEAVTHIKDLRPDLPVIAQSAYVGEKELALNSGFDDFLCKPFTRQQINTFLHKYLND
jgi:PAS domain S-box-containing protein